MDRDGVAGEHGLLSSWPEHGPPEVWRRPLGDGFAAIAIVKGRLYTSYAADRDGSARELGAAFDAATGAQLWEVDLGPSFPEEFGDGPRSTPTVAGGVVYFLGSYGTMVAATAEDGAQRWRLDLREVCAVSQPRYGFSSSVLVHDSLVVVEGGGTEGKAYVGIDATSGKVRWTSGDGTSSAGYSSLVPMNTPAGPAMVSVSGQRVLWLGLDGTELVAQAWPRAETHAMPVVVPPDLVFVSGADPAGSALYRVAGSAAGLTAEEVWKQPLMRNHFSSSVAVGEYIYGFDVATLRCVAVADGSLVWSKRGLGKGSLLAADGHLIILTDKGKLVLAAASPEGFAGQGSVQALKGRCWTVPSLADGKLYLRNHEEMACYNLKGQE